RCAGALSERQHLEKTTALRGSLDLMLSIPGADAYPHVLAWKGVVSDRQARLRSLAQRSKDPEVRKLGRELDETARKLAILSVLSPVGEEAEAHRKELADALARLEEKEKALARAEPTLAIRSLAPKELAARLPEGTALVDLLAFQRSGGKRETAAFVVRAGAEVRRIDLGLEEELEKAVRAWRESVQAGGTGGEALGKLLLAPLRPHLVGVKALLVSPDGPAARIPWGALPGKKAGTWLLEEMAVAVLPVPRQSGTKGEAPSPALLVVGEVDYDAPSAKARAESRSGLRSGTESWAALPGTKAEAEAVSAAFARAFPERDAKLLRKKEATEDGVRRLVAGRTHVHFATHGFFAPERKRASLPPGLLSGLVLAGANAKPDPAADDGILTAREVAELDLSSCELATLSACETGLGLSAGGEGLLGLQRAFQVAGARSALASLWKVPDAATALLMERFYDNLWKRRMGKAEALREAQLFVLEKGTAHPRLLRALKLESGTTTTRAGDRTPPLAWAAWVLSGDGR
ncbi:MAG: CHAT domain-containing protein, partial [Gemmataceae bacterium]|nr:CHAT domain-containing protein [Gemmataceae bacterium]